MNKKLKAFGCAISILGLLAGCAGRTANPVDTVQPLVDRQHDCETLALEVSSNKKKMFRLEDERQKANAANAGIGVVAVIIFVPLLFAMDLKKTEKTEIAALISRNDYLRILAVKRKCGTGLPTRFSKEEYQKHYDKRIKDAGKGDGNPGVTAP
jgi:hypothetical protein